MIVLKIKERREKSMNDNFGFGFNDGYGNSGSENNEALSHSSTPFFYTENYKKKKSSRKPVGLFQLILVAVISAILGGGVVLAAVQFIIPTTQPAAGSYFSNMMPGNTVSQTQDSSHSTTVYKKIEIEETESPVTAISEKVSPSIVGIRVTATTRDFLFGLTQGTGEGSGIIIREDGYIMTNYHVIQNALNTGYGGMTNNAKIEVFLPNQKDTPYIATVVGTDYRTDLAVIKIDAKNLPVAEIGDSDKLKVGELAVAIGNPGGLEYMGSVTVGVISGLNRTIKSENGNELKLIQTDAAINPGNSGGALVNSKGQVIGVNSVKVVAQGFEGLGFAIPINEAVKITDSLIEYKYVKGRPFIGIRPDTSFNKALAQRYNVPEGVLVREVIPFTGAYKAGIQVGDIITKFDGQKVTSLDELNEIKNKHKPGDVVQVEIYRNGQTRTVNLELSEEQEQN